MIIKQTRIPVGDGAALQAYLMNPGENERVESLSGELSTIRDNDLISRLHGRTYGTRHIIISPDKRLNMDELGKVLSAVAQEFGVPDGSLQRMCIVRHEKQRTDRRDGARVHYHVALPEVDDLTGRVMSSSFSKMRCEKVSRLAELVLGHEIIPGRFNREAYSALQAAGVDVRRYEEALREACRREGLSESGWLNYRAKASFSPDTQHAAERKTTADDRFRSPAQVRQHIKGLERDPAAIIRALEADGFEIGPGRKSGTWIVSRDGVPFGSLARLAKLKREQVNEAAIERYGRPTIWDGQGSDASGRPRDERHRAADQGSSRRSGSGIRGTDDSRTDPRAADNAGNTPGRDRAVDEVRSGAGSIPGGTASGTGGGGKDAKRDAIRLGAHIRAADAIRPAQMAALRLRLGGEISRGNRRAEVMGMACNLAARSDSGGADWIGIDGDGFAAAASFLARWAAAQARNMRP